MGNTKRKAGRVTTSVSWDPEILKNAKKAADAEDMPLSQWIRRLVRRELRKRP